MNMGASVELPEYRCHKVVKAAKITGIQRLTETAQGVDVPVAVVLELGEIDGAWTTNEQWFVGKLVEVGGYLVEYEDGYRSYSPAKAFEEGYTKINPSDKPLDTQQKATVIQVAGSFAFVGKHEAKLEHGMALYAIRPERAR